MIKKTIQKSVDASKIIIQVLVSFATKYITKLVDWIFTKKE